MLSGVALADPPDSKAPKGRPAAYVSSLQCQRALALLGLGIVVGGAFALDPIIDYLNHQTFPPLPESGFTAQGNHLAPESSIFGLESDSDEAEFDASVVTDRDKLAIVPWQDFPATNAPVSQTKLPKNFVEATDNFRRYALQGQDRLPEVWEKYRNDPSLKKKTAKELVAMAAEIVMDRLKYEDVDKKIRIQPPDFYWQRCSGDCDKYASLTAMVYNTLKQAAGNEEAVFVLDEKWGSRADQVARDNARRGIKDSGAWHAWVAVVGVDPEGRWRVSHLDPTFADSSYAQGLDAYDSAHIDRRTWRYHFFEQAGAPRSMVREFLHEDLTKQDPEAYRDKVEQVVTSLSRMRAWDQLAALERTHAQLPPELQRSFQEGRMQSVAFSVAREGYFSHLEVDYLTESVRKKDWEPVQRAIDREVRLYGTLHFQRPVYSFITQLKDSTAREHFLKYAFESELKQRETTPRPQRRR